MVVVTKLRCLVYVHRVITHAQCWHFNNCQQCSQRNTQTNLSTIQHAWHKVTQCTSSKYEHTVLYRHALSDALTHRQRDEGTRHQCTHAAHRPVYTSCRPTETCVSYPHRQIWQSMAADHLLGQQSSQSMYC